MYGIVKDSLNQQPMTGAHIRNLTAGSLTSTNEHGKFKMPIQVGDTLLLTSVGYQEIMRVADSSWLQEKEILFLLSTSTVYLDEVVVGQLPEYERFKQMILEEQPNDTVFQVYGMPKVVVGPKSANPSLTVSGPVSMLYSAFSKREKEKRKMQQILEKEHIATQARLKFTREWVAENTGLDGDKLTSFIAFCDFSDDYLASETLFAIRERMLELLPVFLDKYEEKKKYRKG